VLGASNILGMGRVQSLHQLDAKTGTVSEEQGELGCSFSAGWAARSACEVT
jgi:hypothetical protein